MEELIRLGKRVTGDLFNYGSNESLPGLFVALCIAVAFTLARLKRPRPIRFAVLKRAILPRRVFSSASGRTDFAFAVAAFSLFVFVGTAALSQAAVRLGVTTLLNAQFGAVSVRAMPEAIVIAISTVAIYLAYEFAYWLDHYLSHRFEILWRFHAVHHSAESLSALTVFRVHPVDTLVFANILGLVMGTVGGLIDYGFGRPAADFNIGGTNVLMLTAFMLLTTLQHSHFWITFPGVWGKVFLSPAHHQLHHSTDPAHFNKNLGSTLAVWDRLFGTFFLPDRKRMRLTFGVAGMIKPHSLRSTMVEPFIEAGRALIGPKILSGEAEVPVPLPLDEERPALVEVGRS
jgi:sterol desaturase/sphingolipid hydroxylase (fatty acid hydroxylase superfamily)